MGSVGWQFWGSGEITVSGLLCESGAMLFYGEHATYTSARIYTECQIVYYARIYTSSRNEGVMIDLPFKLSAKIRVKIKEKHRVAPQEVAECFYNRAGITLTDNRENHRTDPPTDS